MLSGLIGSLVGGAFGLAGAGAEYAYNKDLASQQNQYNIDMWKMQADYNSPQAQMQRFKDAGLNPNLVYGQGSDGNMSTAPQMVTPEAPELSKHMQRIGEAFNIENLKTIIAKRKEAEAVAKMAETDAERKHAEWTADQLWSNTMMFDTNTGKFVMRPKPEDDAIPIYHSAAYRIQQRLADNYYRQALIPYRQALLDYQKKFLVPQIIMSNYEAGHYPTSYWIGQGTKVLNSLTSIPGTFSPLRWIPRSHPSGSY